MDGLEINGVNFTGFVNNTSGVRKADNSAPLFSTKVADDSGFYPDLKFSPETRMAAEMEKSSFMQNLNEIFGIS